MPNEQIQNLSDLRNDPRNLEIAKLLDMKIPVIFSPLTDPYDERSVLNRLNELGHCVKLVYYPNKKTRATVSTAGFEDCVSISNNHGEALIDAAIATLKR